MSVQDIELLVNKIDKAIKIIQNLKIENKNALEENSLLQSRIEKLEQENKILTSENSSKTSEILKTNTLHDKLENKIREILKYLPDEDSSEIIPVEKINAKKKEKREEEEIIEFVESESGSIKKNLFSNYRKNSENQEVKKPENDNLEKQIEEEIDDDLNIKDDINLIEDNGDEEEKVTENIDASSNDPSGSNDNFLIDNGKEDIDFYFDTDMPDEDLPKGVL